MTPHDLVHLELHTGDPDGAEAFYRGLFGWRPRPSPGGYRSLDIGVSAGIVGCGAAAAVWLPYVEVADVDAATATGLSLGATCTLTPRCGPHGRRSVLRSAAVGDLALWEPA